MLRPPEPCPWETACADCAERLSCSAWLDYAEQVGELLEEELGNLSRLELERRRSEEIGVPARPVMGYRARSYRAPR